MVLSTVVRVAAVAGVMAVAAPSAYAGGWFATVPQPYDRTPTVGEPTSLTFRVLWHGTTPAIDGDVRVVLTPRDGPPRVFRARPEGAPGTYTAVVTIPRAGEWAWSTRGFGIESVPFVRLQAQPAAVAAAVPSAPSRVPLMVGGAAVAAVLGIAGAAAWRRMPRHHSSPD